MKPDLCSHDGNLTVVDPEVAGTTVAVDTAEAVDTNSHFQGLDYRNNFFVWSSKGG